MLRITNFLKDLSRGSGQRFSYRVLLRRSPYKPVFVHVPKTGGSNFFPGRRFHLTSEEYFRMFPVVLKSQKIIAVWRDPIERLNSTISYFVAGGNKGEVGPFADAKSTIHRHSKVSSFDLDTYLCENLDHLALEQRMFWPQYKFVMVNGVFVPDVYVRIGSPDFDRFISSTDNGPVNRSSSSFKASRDLIEVVRRVYAVDYTLQEYTSNYTAALRE